MAKTFFDDPPVLRGEAEEQLAQLYSYLMTMSNNLNTALMDITIEQMAPETQEQIRTERTEELDKQYTGLKSIIIKTAEIVRTEMDEIRTTLTARQQAISDQFGSLETQLTNQITATAEGLNQAFDYIEILSDEAETGEVFRSRFSQYVNVGVIRYDQGRPITGIAIGENITNTDGTINQNNRMATFTMDRLSFYQNGTEVAYFANNKFYITNGEIGNTLKIGNHMFKKLSDGAMALVAG